MKKYDTHFKSLTFSDKQISKTTTPADVRSVKENFVSMLSFHSTTDVMQ